MELSPTLRAQLDLLDPYVEDPDVREILVAGPDRVYVTREGRAAQVDIEAPERRIRALADRLLRALGARPDREGFESGRLGDGLSVAIIGSPRGPRCPVVRLFRNSTAGGGLHDLVAAGALGAEMSVTLEDAVAARQSVLVVAPHGAREARYVAALAAAWAGQGRRLVRDAVDGALAIADVGEIVLPPDTPIDVALATDPDVLIALELDAADWTALTTSGRPFVAALEAPDGPYGLERLVARVLSGDARLSRAAAESLVLSSVGGVLEVRLGADGGLRFGRPELVDGRLRLHVLHTDAAPDAADAPEATDNGRPEPIEAAAPAPMDRSTAVPAPALEAPAPEASPEADDDEDDEDEDEASRTSSFAAAELVEALSQELEAELEAEQAATPPEEPTRFAKDPEASVSPDASRDDLRRPSTRARERLATVTGPPRPSEVANHVAQVLEQFGTDPSGPQAIPPEPSRADIRTAHALSRPNLDPFETQEASFEPGPMDSTQAADVGEMVSDPPAPSPVVENPFESSANLQTRALPAVDDEAWDEEAPSELMSSPPGLEPDPAALEPDPAALEPDEAGATAAGRFDELGLEGLEAALAESPPAEDDGPFENEKTPVAPLFDEDEGRGQRRVRRRPRSSSNPEREGAAQDLGDPTRRRRSPERGRGGRRRNGPRRS